MLWSAGRDVGPEAERMFGAELTFLRHPETNGDLKITRCASSNSLMMLTLV
jgi:hypothetical protein